MSSPPTGGSTSTDTPGGRPKWGTRLTEEMQERLAAAHEEQGLANVAKLMATTGASRSAVRTWIQSPQAPVRLGRPPFFSAKEEKVIAMYMAAWTKGGDMLTCELAALFLRQYIVDVGREEGADRMFGPESIPKPSFFDLFLSRHPELLRERPTAIESVRADASTSEAVAQFFAAFRFRCRDLGNTRAAQVWNTDESMMNTQALMETTAVTVLAPKDST